MPLCRSISARCRVECHQLNFGRFFYAGDGADQRTPGGGISAANPAPCARGNACNHRYGQRGAPARIPMAAERCAHSRGRSAYAREAQRD